MGDVLVQALPLALLGLAELVAIAFGVAIRSPNRNPGTRHEDTIDADGNGLRRTIWGLDYEARNLREVRITDPDGSAQFWCQPWKLNVNADTRRFRLAEDCMPAAYNVTLSSSSTPRTTASSATTPTRQTPAPA